MKLLTVGIFVAVALLLVGVWFLNHQSHALSDARRDAEAARLELRNVEVAHELTQKQLQATEQDLLAKDAELQRVVNEAKAASPGARVTGVASLRTAVVLVTAPPDEPQGPPPPPTCNKDEILAPDGMGSFYCKPQAGVGTTPPGQPTCVLVVGSGVSLTVDEITLATDKGNTLIAGVARAFRERPLPRYMLAEGRFQSALSDANALAPPNQPRWGAEILGACAGSGCGLGAGVLFPPVSFWGLRVEARAGALLGPVVSGVGAVGLRF